MFADVVKKALLLYLLRYGRNLDIRYAAVIADGKAASVYKRKESGTPLVFALTEGRLRIPFSEEWRSRSIEKAIATRSKSTFDGRFSALHALLVAKSDRYEIERFVYYWMSMNGLYAFAAKQGEPLLPLTKKGKTQTIGTDAAEQAFFLRTLGLEPCNLDYSLDKKTRMNQERHILWSATAALKRIPEGEIDSFCEACLKEDMGNNYVQSLRKALKNEELQFDYDFPVKSFAFIWLPYKVRCASFHSESKLPTFCYSHDSALRVIRVLNRLLDSFLTRELPKWISIDPATQAEIQRRIRKAAMNEAYSNAT